MIKNIFQDVCSKMTSTNPWMILIISVCLIAFPSYTIALRGCIPDNDKDKYNPDCKNLVTGWNWIFLASNIILLAIGIVCMILLPTCNFKNISGKILQYLEYVKIPQ